MSRARRRSALSTEEKRSVNRIIATFGAVAALEMAQAPGPPLSDSRLSVSTLVREDIFAGFIERRHGSILQR
jgi:hypothetical protein